MNSTENGTPLCECTSGVSARNCCHGNHDYESRHLPTQYPAAQVDRIKRALEPDQLATLAQQYVDTLETDPLNYTALRGLGFILKKSKNHRANGAVLSRLNKLAVNDVGVTVDLAFHNLEHGDISLAYRHSRNAIRLAPDSSVTHLAAALTLTRINRLAAGEHHFREALRLQQATPSLYANLGMNLKKQGKFTAAEECYHQAIELSPDHPETIFALIELYEASNQFEKAWALLAKISASDPEYPQLKSYRAKLAYREKHYEEGLHNLGNLDQHSSATSWRQQAQLLEKLGRYREAFAAIKTANAKTLEQTPANRHYDEQKSGRKIAQLKEFFTETRVASLPSLKHLIDNRTQPIFIVGFPRSGTTLTEQILSSHTSINAGDELQFIFELAQIAPNLLASDLQYPKCLVDLWLGENMGALEAFHDYYMRKAEQVGLIAKDVRWFTDKMPLNETHLGMIALIFPASPIIHLIRHPLDVVLSTYFTDLTHGDNCSYQLETTATHYMLIKDLVDQYKRSFKLNYHTIKYEDLVTDPEHQIQALLTWIDLPWENDCLNFYQNSRHARTASYAQVSEKLYADSIYRYRNFLEELKPVISILEPAIAELGYEI